MNSSSAGGDGAKTRRICTRTDPPQTVDGRGEWRVCGRKAAVIVEGRARCEQHLTVCAGWHLVETDRRVAQLAYWLGLAVDRYPTKKLGELLAEAAYAAAEHASLADVESDTVLLRGLEAVAHGLASVCDLEDVAALVGGEEVGGGGDGT